MEKYYVGIDLGGTSVKMGLFSDRGELKEKWSIPTDTSDRGSHIIDDIVAAVEKKSEEVQGTIIGLGMGVPGPVSEEGLVHECPNLGWSEVAVRDLIKDKTGIARVAVGNDANVAALGEMWKGGGRGFDSIVMITLGTGVGGGVILGGKILSGANGGAGEVGHILVNPDETQVCGCGKKGCLEQYASATGVVRLAKKYQKPESVLAQKDKINCRVVFDAAKEEDPYALEVVDQFAKYLGRALGTIAQVVNPEAFVIGGGVSNAGDIIMDNVVPYFKESVIAPLRDTKFAFAQLGNDAGIYGAVRLVL